MKNKKKRQIKILSILLLISLMVPIFTMQTFALSTKFELNPNKTVVSQGDKVTIKVKTKDVNQISSGINSYVGVLGYDSQYLSYESATTSVDGWMFVYNQTSKGIIGYDPTGADFKKSDFEVFTLTFKVLDNAPLGDTTITFKDIDVADGNGGAHLLGDSETTLTIVEPKTTEPDPKSSNNNMSEIIVSAGSLSPKFSADNTEYDVQVDHNTDSITIGGKTANNKATISKGLGSHVLNDGKNTIIITVVAEDGTTKDYVINVTKKEKPLVTEPDPKSSNNNMSEIIVSAGSLSPKFSADNTEYDVQVDHNTDSITIGGKTANNKATISKGLGSHVLNDGKNTIIITVVAEDGTTKDYVINVTKKEKPLVTDPEPKPDPDLKPTESKEDGANITIKNNYNSSNNFVLDVQGLGQLNKEFSKNDYKYGSIVGRETTSVNPIIVLEDDGATYRLIGADDLKLGKNYVILEVTAANGDIREYQFEIDRSEGENNALLASLQVGGYAFNPGFREDINYYTLTVDSEVSALGVSASPKFGGSLVNIVGNDKLDYGVNFIKVSVNGDKMMNTYLVEVIREHELVQPSLLPWIIAGASLLILLMLFIVMYVANRIDKKAEERRMREFYYSQNNKILGQQMY